MVYSALAASAALFSMASASWTDMGCLGVFEDGNSIPVYPLDTCIPRISEGVESATMYACENSATKHSTERIGILTSTVYNSLDCSDSGTITATDMKCPESGPTTLQLLSACEFATITSIPEVEPNRCSDEELSTSFLLINICRPMGTTVEGGNLYMDKPYMKHGDCGDIAKLYKDKDCSKAYTPTPTTAVTGPPTTLMPTTPMPTTFWPTCNTLVGCSSSAQSTSLFTAAALIAAVAVF